MYGSISGPRGLMAVFLSSFWFIRSFKKWFKGSVIWSPVYLVLSVTAHQNRSRLRPVIYLVCFLYISALSVVVLLATFVIWFDLYSTTISHQGAFTPPFTSHISNLVLLVHNTSEPQTSDLPLTDSTGGWLVNVLKSCSDWIRHVKQNAPVFWNLRGLLSLWGHHFLEGLLFATELHSSV